uniref:C2H2-type domain-containing protein n=2 Tax=Rhizophagus irregularis TaxID=588596 RepID=U9UWA1_RHIID
MVDLISITKEEPFHEFTHNEDSVKPFWCLLTDGGPDENPRFLANISKYLLLFKKLDLDYLTVRTHAPGQSTYNPVERNIASLSGKLASIELDAFAHGKHLGSINGKVTIVDEDLGHRNFRHAGERLCELWGRDKINGHPVITTYVEEHNRSDFLDIEEELWDWIDRHAQICKYSLDIRKCKDQNYCSQPRAPEIYNILSANNGFLPPITKGCDGHFLNLVHTLEYFGKKLPGYDEYCPSISQDQYPSFVCQKCFRYYSTKMFLKLHIKMTHSNEKAPKSGVTNEKTESLPRDYGCNVENTKDNEISNHEIRNVQVFQEEKPVKKGKSRPHQQNLTAKPWEQDHLTFKI